MAKRTTTPEPEPKPAAPLPVEGDTSGQTPAPEAKQPKAPPPIEVDVDPEPRKPPAPPFPPYIMTAVFKRAHESPKQAWQRRKVRHQELYAAALVGLLASSNKVLLEVMEEAATVADASLVFEEHRYIKRGLPAVPDVGRT